MIYTQTYRIQFSAGHVLENHPFCGKLHGHSYRVEVTIVGDPDPDVHNLIAAEAGLMSVVNSLRNELNGRHLNDMLPATIPSAQGVAAFFWEKLALVYKMQEVTVWQDDLAVSLRRDRLSDQV